VVFKTLQIPTRSEAAFGGFIDLLRKKTSSESRRSEALVSLKLIKTGLPEKSGFFRSTLFQKHDPNEQLTELRKSRAELME
jgi:hypothetical protein